MISVAEAIRRLKDGNERYRAGDQRVDAAEIRTRRATLVEGQNPFAVVLGCSDSRVPVEPLFDQGAGDLFVVRVAGNIVSPPLLGSIEYAVEHLGVRLVVVLGHTGCGAVQATLSSILQPPPPLSPNLEAVVGTIRPVLERLVAEAPDEDPSVLAARAVRANVRASMVQLRGQSEILRRLADGGDLVVLGAEYDLASGAVTFFERDEQEFG